MRRNNRYNGETTREESSELDRRNEAGFRIRAADRTRDFKAAFRFQCWGLWDRSRQQWAFPDAMRLGWALALLEGDLDGLRPARRVPEAVAVAAGVVTAPIVHVETVDAYVVDVERKRLAAAIPVSTVTVGEPDADGLAPVHFNIDGYGEPDAGQPAPKTSPSAFGDLPW